MRVFPRAEVQAAFTEYRRRGAERQDWAGWADLFTDDALYVEHNLGTFHGGPAIKDWIVSCMSDFPAMTLWMEWSVIEGNHVAFYIWNNLPDPAGGKASYQFPNSTLIEYAGDGKWRYEEEFYNPHDAERVFKAWLAAGGRRTTPQDPSLEGVAGWAPQPSAVVHPREEVEAEFAKYVERGQIAVATGNWSQWADQFTTDARYLEHHYGRFSGREEIRSWICSVMQPFPEMEFPVTWHGIDGNRVVMLCPNRLPDPSGGEQLFEFPVLVELHYAGNGQWSYEEDVYNPDEAPKAVAAWVAAGGKLPEGLAPPT
jgi:predicted SnoaL-like aldol condensation-catalyzing enzyme